MAEGLILETSFFIDLEREERGAPGPAQAFLDRQSTTRFYTTFTVAGELAAGFGPDERALWEGVLGSLNVLHSSPEVSWRYGETYRYLSENGLLIGSGDLWIAATALAYALPLVTADEAHYRRVPGLSIVGYRSA